MYILRRPPEEGLEIAEVEAIKKWESEDKVVIWITDIEEDDNPIRIVSEEDLYDFPEDAIKSVINNFEERIEELKKEKKEWESKL